MPRRSLGEGGRAILEAYENDCSSSCTAAGDWTDGARGGAKVKADPPSAVVFYLTRLPSHSRATAEYFAQTKATRSIPLIFVGGEAEALEKTRKKIPTGIFISEDKLATTLEKYAAS